MKGRYFFFGIFSPSLENRLFSARKICLKEVEVKEHSFPAPQRPLLL